ncbi:class I SAM-dependent methyltransferase [Methylobacterium oryzihabitans]|uniref:Class I SAM-dependent methyltransferase n=1 Tax=Methylobacterium oryzihabitans TaxID=2499852 RepID=A0A3S2YKT8_9HYPH|nr:class I SAM-dependent methyltransferase [Methylobacterium oryzihabitans]RVU13806.1 class I SAM-dependent methyltransferase [Methylobacterium oryzihabitans]
MMPSLAQLSQHFNAVKEPGYLEIYEEHFGHLRDKPINVLEIGVHHGGSLLMWSEYFRFAHVVGIDIMEPPVRFSGNIRFCKGRQDDPDFLRQVAASVRGGRFDIIIDDGSHFGLYTKIAYETLFDEHLSSGGYYVIEDWGTGYWDDWPDGSRYQPAAREWEMAAEEKNRFVYVEEGSFGHLPKLFHSHQFGMVGFVKQLVDEAHYGAIRNVSPRRPSKFRTLNLSEGVALIRKR